MKPKEAEGQEMALKEGCMKKGPPSPLSFIDGPHAQKPFKRKVKQWVVETHRVIFESTSSEVFIP